MSTADGAIDQKPFCYLKGIYYFRLPKTDMQIKRLASTKFYLQFSVQIKQRNRYSNIVNNLKFD